MKKRISMLALATLFAATSAQASGYRIPEQSVDSTAKAGANIASATRADAAYFNPANMSFMEDRWMVQGNMSYIHLTKIKYDDSRKSAFDAESEDENFILPTFFAVSPSYNDFRFGLSITSPNGLSKRWKDDNTFARSASKEFSLKTAEINPTVSYAFSDAFSVAVGVRAFWADATLTNDLFDFTDDTWEWGYNLAAAIKPTEDTNISVTYRSNIDLDWSVSDAVYPHRFGNGAGRASAGVPSPAVLALSTSFKPIDKLTVELTVDRTFWSEYEDLTIKNDGYTFPGSPYNPYVSEKKWDDTDAFRIGLTYEYSETLSLMGGFAYDSDPIPEKNIGYELPDSRAWIYSAGFQYKYTENLEFGMAVLYDYKEERKATNSPITPTARGMVSSVDGEFTNASAWFVTAGINYKF